MLTARPVAFVALGAARTELRDLDAEEPEDIEAHRDRQRPDNVSIPKNQTS